jgi:hypothetical protein
MAEDAGRASSILKPPSRRSVTLPLQPSESISVRRSSTGGNAVHQVETLYIHPNVRIVAFSTASSWNSRPTPKSESKSGEECGTLRWTSSIERLIAVGKNAHLILGYHPLYLLV